MNWEYKYDAEIDETVIYWNKEQQTTIDGKITKWQNGYPMTDDAREAIAELIQSAGTPERIRMQFDFNYGFSEIVDNQEE